MKGDSINLKDQFFYEIKPRIDSTIGQYWESIDEDCECGFINYEFKNYELYEISSQSRLHALDPAYGPDFRARYVDGRYGDYEIIIEGRTFGKTITWTINGYVSFSIQDLIFKLQDILAETFNCECWSD